MPDLPRRYVTEVESESGLMLRVTSMPLPAEGIPEALQLMYSEDLIASELPTPPSDFLQGGPMELVEKDDARPRRKQYPEWDPELVASFFRQFTDEGAELVQATLTSGRIVVEASPARIRRLVTVPIVWAVVLHSPTPAIALASGSVLFVLELVGATIGATISGLHSGIEKGVEEGTTEHVRALADSLWRRIRHLPPRPSDDRDRSFGD